jgi:hypothetical protein
MIESIALPALLALFILALLLFGPTGTIPRGPRDPF